MSSIDPMKEMAVDGSVRAGPGPTRTPGLTYHLTRRSSAPLNPLKLLNWGGSYVPCEMYFAIIPVDLGVFKATVEFFRGLGD